jgi:hypothetical protein
MASTAAVPTPGPDAVKLVSLDQPACDYIAVVAALDPDSVDIHLENAKIVRLLKDLHSQHDLLPTYNTNATAAVQHTLCTQAAASREEELVQATDKLTAAEEQILELSADNRRLKKAVDNAQTLQALPNAPESFKAVKIPDPPKFEKGREEYRTFKAKLNEKVRIEATRFRSDDHQVAYAMGYLEGDAYRAVKPLRENGEINTIPKLLQFLDATYEDPDPKATAAAELRKLKQANKEFAVHYSAFQRIMATLQYDKEAKRQALYDSLSEELKDQLVSHDEPEDWNKYVGLLQRVDQKIRSRTLEKKNKAQITLAPQRSIPRTTPSPAHSNNPKDSWANKSFHGSAPMDLSAYRRTQERQQAYEKRMQAGVCTRCGDPKKDGHLRAQCPQKSMVLNAAATDQQDVGFPAATDVSHSSESGKE